MSIQTGPLSLPQEQTYAGKFCLPEPTNLNGTFSTSANGRQFTITSITRSGTTATVTVAAGHNLQTGNFVKISGAAQVEYNTNAKVTVTSATVFTFRVESTAVTPATGTIIGLRPGCDATGVGTLATVEMKAGDFIYVSGQNALRQIDHVYDDTHWSFSENFATDVSAAPVKQVQGGLYKGVSVNTGAGGGTLCEKSVAATQTHTWADMVGLNPLCGEASGGTFVVILQKNSSR